MAQFYEDDIRANINNLVNSFDETSQLWTLIRDQLSSRAVMLGLETSTPVEGIDEVERALMTVDNLLAETRSQTIGVIGRLGWL